MQAPRNWRMKNQRYQLTGTQAVNGSTSVVNRPEPLQAKREIKPPTQQEVTKVAAA